MRFDMCGDELPSISITILQTYVFWMFREAIKGIIVASVSTRSLAMTASV